MVDLLTVTEPFSAKLPLTSAVTGVTFSVGEGPVEVGADAAIGAGFNGSVIERCALLRSFEALRIKC